MQETFRLLVSRAIAVGIEVGVILVADKTDQIDTEEKLLAGLRRGITDWVVETEEGREVYASSVQDFNFGDLAELSDHQALGEYIKAAGVLNFSLESVVLSDHMHFDIPLVYDDEVKD